MNALNVTLLALTIGSLAIGAGAAEAKKKSRTLTALSPVASAVIAQNDPATGCTDDATRGFGFMIAFDWSDTKTLRGNQTYTLTVQHAGSLPDTFTDLKTTSFIDTECNSFVIDSNLANWTWTVSVVTASGKVKAVSQASPFAFSACRLANGQPCNAP